MTLLVSVFAAIICTVIWYRNAPKDEMRVSILCWMFWGASLMWLVDAIFEFAELGAAHLVLWHTEDATFDTRKQAYTAEAARSFSGQIHVPWDLERLELT